ncbi:MAG: hypothetical protein WD512_16520 [Candidatus Paceibacterota bacterium]
MEKIEATMRLEVFQANSPVPRELRISNYELMWKIRGIITVFSTDYTVILVDKNNHPYLFFNKEAAERKIKEIQNDGR